MAEDLEKRRNRHREYMRNRYQNDPKHREAHKAKVKNTKRGYIAEVKGLIQAFKANGCGRCSEKEGCCLVAHHVDPSTKLFELANARDGRYTPAQVQAELAKCVCVCLNCHAKIHAGLIENRGVA